VVIIFAFLDLGKNISSSDSLLGNGRWTEVCSVYKQVLAITTINGFFQAVLFALVSLSGLLRYTTLQ